MNLGGKEMMAATSAMNDSVQFALSGTGLR
jgi:hypothetical protein